MKYSVNGIEFLRFDYAQAYAMQRAMITGRSIHVMEKLDTMTAWHIVWTAQA